MVYWNLSRDLFNYIPFPFKAQCSKQGDPLGSFAHIHTYGPARKRGYCIKIWRENVASLRGLCKPARSQSRTSLLQLGSLSVSRYRKVRESRKVVFVGKIHFNIIKAVFSKGRPYASYGLTSLPSHPMISLSKLKRERREEEVTSLRSP